MLLSALVHIRLFQICGSSPESINNSHAFSTAAERGREEPKKLAVLQECPQGQVPLRQACNFLSFEDLADLWRKQQAAEGWDWKRRCPLQHCWKKKPNWNNCKAVAPAGLFSALLSFPTHLLTRAEGKKRNATLLWRTAASSHWHRHFK